MTTVTIAESGAPCFPHESMLTPPPEEKPPPPSQDKLSPPTENKRSHIRSPHRKSPSPGRRYNGDGKGIQVDIGARLREYVDCLNNQKWNVIGTHLADQLQRNGHPQTREEHITRLKSRVENLAGFRIKIDTMLVDKKAQAVAARYVNVMTPAADPVTDVDDDAVGKTSEFDEQCYVWFDGKGKIARIVTLQDNDGIRARNPTAEMTPRFLTRRMPEEPVDLGALYRAYVASINNRTMSREFPRFCRKELRHNNRPFSVEDYWRNIEYSQDAIPDLKFEIQELLVDEDTQQVAARLALSGTPVAEFAGMRPNGRGIRFHEHCMYRFDKGKIALVWATMELDVVRRQLEVKTDRRKSSTLGIN